jgi:hypothetical protein
MKGFFKRKKDEVLLPGDVLATFESWPLPLISFFIEVTKPFGRDEMFLFLPLIVSKGRNAEEFREVLLFYRLWSETPNPFHKDEWGGLE